MQAEKFTGSRNKEDLTRFILDHAEVDIRHVRSADDWTRLTDKSDYPSWLLLLCNSNVLHDCPHGDMRTKLAAILVCVILLYYNFLSVKCVLSIGKLLNVMYKFLFTY